MSGRFDMSISSDSNDKVRHYSLSERDDWMTPGDFINDLRLAVEGVDLDPCAHEQSTIGRVNYRLEDGQDGLEKEWFGTVFVNPPFSYKSDWLEKAVHEIREGNCDTVVMLTPDGTDTVSWWHEYIAEYAQYICFHKGRMKYLRYDEATGEAEKVGSPPFGTAISVFGAVPTDLLNMLQRYGHVVKTVESVIQ